MPRSLAACSLRESLLLQELGNTLGDIHTGGWPVQQRGDSVGSPVSLDL